MKYWIGVVVIAIVIVASASFLVFRGSGAICALFVVGTLLDWVRKPGEVWKEDRGATGE